MQENLLAANPTADIAVHVVWEPMLGGRREQAVEATSLMPDSRVRHFWNETFIVGQFFQDAAYDRTAMGRPVWDIYFLFGSEATWQQQPGPLLSSGFTVFGRRDQLGREFMALLAPAGSEPAPAR